MEAVVALDQNNEIWIIACLEGALYHKGELLVVKFPCITMIKRSLVKAAKVNYDYFKIDKIVWHDSKLRLIDTNNIIFEYGGKKNSLQQIKDLEEDMTLFESKFKILQKLYLNGERTLFLVEPIDSQPVKAKIITLVHKVTNQGFKKPEDVEESEFSALTNEISTILRNDQKLHKVLVDETEDMTFDDKETRLKNLAIREVKLIQAKLQEAIEEEIEFIRDCLKDTSQFKISKQYLQAKALLNTNPDFVNDFLNEVFYADKPAESSGTDGIRFNRFKIDKFKETRKMDLGEAEQQTVFTQMTRTMKDSTRWRKDDGNGRVIEAYMIGEGSTDDGGPGREAIDTICIEV